MKQIRIRLINRHRDFQSKPHNSFKNKKHKFLMYRYAYKVDITVQLPVKFREIGVDMLHGYLVDKPYAGFINKRYGTFNHNYAMYVIDTVVQIPLKQRFNEGMNYDVLGAEQYKRTNERKYRDIQQINEYVVHSTINI